jgi:hypothetical protein
MSFFLWLKHFGERLMKLHLNQIIMRCIPNRKGKKRTSVNRFIGLSNTLVLFVMISCVLIACIASPALAGTKYMTGSPNLTASIVGNNEFTPGTTVPLQIRIQNSGLNKLKFVESGIIDRDDNPNTAKMVTASLLTGDSPAFIKSDPQMIGDIKGSESVTANFDVLIPDDAETGIYTMPVILDYTYLSSADQEGTDTISYRYWNKKVQCDLTFIVQSTITVDVIDVQTDNINAGGSGNVTVTLKNTGRDTGMNAIVFLNRSGESPITPISNGVYIGTFAPNSMITATYKVSVSEDAHPQKYPIGVGVVFDNKDSETLVTPQKIIGVPVGSKVHFTVISKPSQINPGNKNPIEVTYRNDGSVSVHSAEVRISAVDPFTSADDLSFLGDLKPGEEGTARFGLTLSGDADTKTYGLDSEVKYRDSLDDSHVSDTIKVPIHVVKPEGIAGLVSNPVVIAVILILILGGVYALREKQRKQKPK